MSYCLRDLKRTRPRARSPRGRVYPACNTNPAARRVRLGTSVGWSDIYPPAYPEQYLDVTGLRGCFAYRHTADPRNGIYESNEEQQRRPGDRAAAVQAGSAAVRHLGVGRPVGRRRATPGEY